MFWPPTILTPIQKDDCTIWDWFSMLGGGVGQTPSLRYESSIFRFTGMEVSVQLDPPCSLPADMLYWELRFQDHKNGGISTNRSSLQPPCRYVVLRAPFFRLQKELSDTRAQHFGIQEKFCTGCSISVISVSGRICKLGAIVDRQCTALVLDFTVLGIKPLHCAK